MTGITGVSGNQSSYPAGNSGGSSLKNVQKQYPELSISAQSFGSESAVRNYAMKQSGKYNVAIDPRALSRMEKDSEFSGKINDVLSSVKELDDEFERRVNGRGAELVSCGTIIDKEGNVSSWSVSRTAGANGKNEDMFSVSKKSYREILEELEEKRLENIEERKTLEESSKVESEVNGAQGGASSGAGGVNVVG